MRLKAKPPQFGNISEGFMKTLFSEDSKTDVTENVTETTTYKRVDLILSLLKSNNRLTIDEIAEKLNITRCTVIRDIEKLKNNELIKRIGPAKGGYWQLINK
ncbi:MAG: HTH domain-containing protein [Bacteroidales bacterium]